MNRDMRRMINDRRRDGARGYSRDRRSGYRVRGDYAADDMNYDGNYGGRDSAYDDDMDRPEYAEEYEMSDGRRGVKGTGPYGIGGRRHYPRRDRARNDGDDEPMHLSRRDMSEWKRSLENADGTQGAHFDAQQIEQAIEALGIRPRGYDEKTLCMTANMLYSDYCEVLKQFIPREKEALIYVKLAKAFLDDDDAAVQGNEKLAAYYYIVCDDE